MQSDKFSYAKPMSTILRVTLILIAASCPGELQDGSPDFLIAKRGTHGAVFSIYRDE
ncbi:MAG: hypothetical protein RR573_04545 [Oscillospiraceae bacterium]